MDLFDSNISTDSNDEDDELLDRIKLFVANDLLVTSPLLSSFHELFRNESPESSVENAHSVKETTSEHDFKECEEDLSNEALLKISPYFEETTSEEDFKEFEEVLTKEAPVNDVNYLEETNPEENLKEFGEILTNEALVSEANYFEVTIPGYSLEEFECHFRMSRGSFADLMEQIAGSRRILGLEMKLLFVLWILSNEESFSCSARRFNIAKSSGHQSYCEVLDALFSIMGNFIKWPSTSQFKIISNAFQEKSGGYIPGILGAIGGCRIEIRKPLKNDALYLDRNNKYSVILQAVCDHRAIFTNVYIGGPGGANDEIAYKNNPLSAKLDGIIPGNFHLVGNSEYPLSERLVTPFHDNGNLLEKQKHFNTSLNSARMTIRRAFSLMKRRFQRLKYLDVTEPMMGNRIVNACCVLHNHIQSRSEEDVDDVEIDTDGDDDPAASPQGPSLIEDNRSSSSSQKRNYLLSFF